ncbi:MAG: serine/threonine protein kinase [Pelodictyon luteolum]|uniref:Serine/threonine protein kinase n=1 Tax=Pelodictyon luteolum TaxID=1100 RepID=A0A165LPS2_PELLU|nr:ATP-binding protein [Pelodictyon luteolum]KZK74275.1 MAG: serine/threonine protein kinase [Pelodictyon luteolum]
MMPEERIRVDAKLDRLEEIVGFVEDCADRFRLEDSRKFGLNIAVEEAVVNICSYAYPDTEGMLDVACRVTDESLVIELSDSGIPFNILTLPDPETDAAIEDREIGGLGGYFIRQFSDAVSYTRRDGMNVLTLLFRRGASIELP